MATIPSSILILDERLAVLTVNHNFLEKSRGNLNSIVGRKLHEIFPPAFQDTALDQQIRDVISSGRTIHRQRMTYRAPGVSLRTYSYSICPLQLHGGARGAILVMDDVTDLLQPRRGSAPDAAASRQHRRERRRPHHLDRSGPARS